MDREKEMKDRSVPGQCAWKERQLAARWNISLRTLQRWRSDGLGPGYILIGGTIRYLMDDILEFESRHRRTSGDQQ